MIEITEWLVEHLRLTAFHATTPDGSASEWQALMGTEPEDRSAKPREASLDESGPMPDFGEPSARLSLHMDPLRVDWRLTFPEILDDPGHSTSFQPALDVFQPLMLRWLATRTTGISRLAFGAVLLLPKDSPELATAAVGDMLPFTVDPGATDLFYQINHPVVSTTVPGYINVLRRWAVLNVQRQRMDISLSDDGARVVTPLGETTFCRLELDVSTPAHSAGELSDVAAVWNELVRCGHEVAEQGEPR